MPGAGAEAATKPRSDRGFVVFRWLVYALLAGDVVLYARFGRATELLDTAAWFVLLLLFEWETGGWKLPSRWRPALHGVRALAAVAVVVACVGYALERVWLDFANEMVWLGVIALLEVEVRLPPGATVLHRIRRAMALVLYLALVAFMLTWAAMGLGGEAVSRESMHAAWLDAWDALLWLVAFVAIELNVFGLAPSRPRRDPRGTHPAPRS